MSYQGGGGVEGIAKLETIDEEQEDLSHHHQCQGFRPCTTQPGHRAPDIVDRQHTYHVRVHQDPLMVMSNVFFIHAKPPPLYLATIGLSTMYKTVTEGKNRRKRTYSWGHGPEERMYTCADGTLRLGPHLPLFMGRYRFVRLIGQGTFAQIICAEDTFHPSRRQVAIKILNFHYAEIGKREALCLRAVHATPEGQYSAIVKYHAAFDFMGHFCIVMELCQGGSFQTYIRPIQEAISPATKPRSGATHLSSSKGGGLSLAQCREAALHLVKALLLLHNQDIIHADIKPENVLMVAKPSLSGSLGQQVRLTDLGNAIKSREVKLYKEDYEIQTLGYRAPEILLGGAGGRAFDHKIDLWSLGVLLVELYLGRPLFCAASKMLMVKRITSVLGPLPARTFITGKFYTGFFGPDHRLKREALTLKDDPVHEATALLDPAKIKSAFKYDSDAHYRLICDLLRSRDRDFISFVCGLLQLDPESRFSAFEALMHPFLAPCFPFTLLRPFLNEPSIGLRGGGSAFGFNPPVSDQARGRQPAVSVLMGREHDVGGEQTEGEEEEGQHEEEGEEAAAENKRRSGQQQDCDEEKASGSPELLLSSDSQGSSPPAIPLTSGSPSPTNSDGGSEEDGDEGQEATAAAAGGEAQEGEQGPSTQEILSPASSRSDGSREWEPGPAEGHHHYASTVLMSSGQEGRRRGSQKRPREGGNEVQDEERDCSLEDPSPTARPRFASDHGYDPLIAAAAAAFGANDSGNKKMVHNEEERESKVADGRGMLSRKTSSDSRSTQEDEGKEGDRDEEEELTLHLDVADQPEGEDGVGGGGGAGGGGGEAEGPSSRESDDVLYL